jgi:hypothetical protein
VHVTFECSPTFLEDVIVGIDFQRQSDRRLRAQGQRDDEQNERDNTADHALSKVAGPKPSKRAM